MKFELLTFVIPTRDRVNLRAHCLRSRSRRRVTSARPELPSRFSECGVQCCKESLHCWIPDINGRAGAVAFFYGLPYYFGVKFGICSAFHCIWNEQQ